MTEDIGRKLLQLKEQLEEEKSQRSELQGEYKSVMKQLKDDHGAESLEQAEKKIKKEQEELQEMEESIRERVEEVESLMEEGE